MTVDRWAQAVRQQLGIGRLLPLGGPGDGAWISEAAAREVLRRSVTEVRGVRLGSVRLSQADPDGVYEAGVPAPPSALPPGPLRIVAECEATVDEPLPAATARLRAALSRAADEGLGLVVTEVDLQVTALLDGPPGEAGPDRDAAPEEPAEAPSLSGDEARAAQAALAVPGVARLTGKPAGLGRAVHIEERPGEASLPRRHVRVELAVSAGARALDTARAVRQAVSTALPDGPSVAVLVTGATAEAARTAPNG
ncbi:nucleopolyhedrovirus P10 family protein [Streptomyces kunmingensis]|uniref:Nucleopolyhedrovirus P10 family protein n=1 Tax=Streptomyces kunmingensis TaxID=68225 RepID=A0ABU6CIU3_9ACTN|nr:nucleopolyhedrovirus P10 family protein [Streptomyces kunmingensis]MEB3964608.1 nucleopolyhedrovirus P10 family protein [Streptomyces kunmingensis]